jgi:hypothetical protein
VESARNIIDRGSVGIVRDSQTILRDRHLLICGGTPEKRLDLARRVVESAANSEADLYELPARISTIDDYLHAAQDVFPIFSPIEYLGWLRKIFPFLSVYRMPKRWMNLDQVWDMHLDWVELRERTLIFWPEAKMVDVEEFLEILSDYVTWKFVIDDPGARQKPEGYRPPWFRLVVTTPHVPENLHESLALGFGRGEEDKRTEADIAREHLGVVRVGDAGSHRDGIREESAT